jgi:Ulp1 family protease
LEKIKTLHNIPDFAPYKGVQNNSDDKFEVNVIDTEHRPTPIRGCISYSTKNLDPNALHAIRSETTTNRSTFETHQDSEIDNIPISGEMLRKLSENDSWLNDEVINAFYKLLGAAYEKSIFLSTYFWPTLLSGVNVTSYIKKYTSGKSLLENYYHMILPINHNNQHW